MFFALATSFAATAGAWQFTVINADTPAKPEEVVIANAVEPVVVEPPASFGVITTHAGFIVGESYDLEALGMKAVKGIAPAGMSEDSAVAVIEKHFPDVAVESAEFAS